MNKPKKYPPHASANSHWKLLHSQTDPAEPKSYTYDILPRPVSPSAANMKAFGIAIASVALAAVLAADSNTLPANKNTAPSEPAVTLPNMPAPDADIVEPVATMSSQAQEPNDKAEPQMQPPDDNAPPQTQAQTGQVQPASNDSRVSGIAQSPTPVPLANDMKLAPVRLASGNTLAVLSDVGPQSVILATALTAEPNALSAKTAALQTTATPPTSAALGLSVAVPVTAMPPQTQAPTTKAPPQTQAPTTKAPPQTQAPTGQVQLVNNDIRMPSDTSAPRSNDIQPARVNPTRGDTTTPPPGADTALPATTASPQTQAPNAGTPPQMQPPNADAPPQTQAPNNNDPPQTEVPNAGAPQPTQAPNIQAQLANNNTQAPGNDTLTPHVNDTKPTFVKPIDGKPLATSSDSGSQSADVGDENENERTSTSESESHSGSGFNSSKLPKSKPKKSDAATATATAGLVSAAVVVVVVGIAFM